MGIFNFRSSEPERSVNLQDIFKLKIYTVPNDSFHEQGEPIEMDGKIVRTFSKSFIEENDFECGLFDVVDVKTFQGFPNKNLIFTNESIVIGEFELSNINRLTNQLHKIYGKDDDGNKQFSNKDVEDINFGYWNRHWSKHKNPAMMTFDDEYGLSLTIWLTE
ncbi:MAG: hypothetical protein WBA61_01825 [Aequorivita sp.]